MTSDMLANGAVFAKVAPPGGLPVPPGAPIARVMVERWLRRRGGRLAEAQFLDDSGMRWVYPDAVCNAP
ncbi:MAG: hypothetical protein AB7N65_07045 [Vicinamibacterales bacterium]